jgi:sialic acid synthase SpsE
MRPIAIGKRSLAEGPPYLIAEAGVNHDGDPQRAFDLVDIAAKAGADAVKFQMFEARTLAVPSAPPADYQRRVSSSQFEMLESLELDRPVFSNLASHARDLGLEFICTPFSIETARYLVESLGLSTIKVSSGDLTYTSLLRYLSATGRTVLLSTGMANEDEIDRALIDLGGADVVLLHCVSQYPAPETEANVRALEVLRRRTGDPVGFSDHFSDVLPSILATAMGARVIERHFTYDKTAAGPDHSASMSPEDLAGWVDLMHRAFESCGTGMKLPQPSEAETRMVVRRSLVAAEALSAGRILTDRDLDALRPGDGVSPQHIDRFTGSRLRRDLAAGEQISMDDVD